MTETTGSWRRASGWPCQGRGRLYVGAEGSAPLRLRWVVEPAPPQDGTAGTVRAAA
ncbi:hypothetical protein [Paracidovorax cattleyae]|uniref:hypothetical protein n=1 Tax=Paracidovorax cattleyae TaxID=80868 RepID=UPI0018AF6760|nr:hypothetical protein [Paracidovorax cattleyae]MBF9264265.1 hypothetical protein [Paracidovorax cattleyae]